MHLPWTQIANEVLDHAAPELAVALPWHEDPEVSEALALRGLVKLFRWARERCPNDRPPSASAVLAGPTAARLIARTMGWGGEPETLVEALERVQPSPIVTRTPEGVRINGLDRYDGAWRKNYKDAAAEWDRRHPPPGTDPNGHRPETGRKADGPRPVPARQIQIQTQIQNGEPPPPAGGESVVVGERETASLFDAMQMQREEVGLPREARAPKGFRTWHLEFRGAGHQDEQALRGHRDFLWDTSIRRPGHPTGVFIHPEVWPLRIPPPGLPSEPRARAGAFAPPPTGPAPEPRAAAEWAVMIATLREEGKTYAVSWLERLVPVALTDGELTLESPDEFFLGWVREHYGELLVRLGRERSLTVQLRTPGPAPPVPAGGALAEQVHVDERPATAAEGLRVVRDAVGGS